MLDKKKFNNLEQCFEIFKSKGHQRVNIPMSAFEFLINTVKQQKKEIEELNEEVSA